MTRKTVLCANTIYHIYNRGVDKRMLFLSEKDFKRFLGLLYICNNKERVHLSSFTDIHGNISPELFNIKRNTIVDIIAYCLMGNHFHILAHNNSEAGISEFIQRVSTGYSMYFNKKYERSGSLFQGPYKAKFVSDDSYLQTVFDYIHNNPFDSDEDSFDYPWSSLMFYENKHDDPIITSQGQALRPGLDNSTMHV